MKFPFWRSPPFTSFVGNKNKVINPGGYKIRNQDAIHFLMLTVVEWVDVFTRKTYRDTLLDSIRFCQDKEGLLLHCWCLMSNHIHLIASARNQDLSDVLRDLKKFTSKSLITAIAENPQESRKSWMLEIFRREGEKTAEIKTTSSGNKITIPRNFIVRYSFIKKSTMSIITRLKPELWITPGNIYIAAPGTIIS